jgi:hypothetical protein
LSSGNVQPYTSPHDPSPITPNTPPPSNPQPLPSNLSDPELSMYWTTAPDFSPQANPSGSGSSPSVVVDHASIAVDLGSLRSTENGLLSASSVIVGAYENLKALYQADASWVYGQDANDTAETYTGGYNGADSWTTLTTADPIQQKAVAFANGDGSAANPGINAVQQYALQAIGNAMGLLGEFIVAINNAGATYAQADESSKLPPPS